MTADVVRGRGGVATRTGLVVHRASRVEDLLAPLVARLRDDPPADPFQSITIVVQSRGMQRWLSHQLAERLDPQGRGIIANVVFPFPAAVITDIVAACGGPDTTDPWSRDQLVWPLLELLGSVHRRPGMERLAAYLDGAAGNDGRESTDEPRVIDRRAWGLARGIADVFDRYALYRPSLARAWSRGELVGPDGGALPRRDVWQAHLWAALARDLGDPTERLQAAIDRLSDPQPSLGVATLPPQLLSFGISTLPPRHLELLAAVAMHTPVDLYVPTASDVRWERIGAARDGGSPRPEPAHPLLVSCGRLFDDAAELLLGRARSVPPVPGAPEGQRHPRDLLSALQSGIRADVAPGQDEPVHLEVVDGRATDHSVQVHSCHGPARQVEVLRDAILGLFADDPTLEPRDVLVMTPDIDAFAPLVQAGFGGSDAVPDLPVTVADRQVGRSNPVADALLAILDLASGRAGASRVLDVLGRDVVRGAFGLTPDDIDRVTGWIADSGVRWGIDADHRRRLGQPPDRIHTWTFGLDRLLLGAVMADEDDRIVGDVTPYDHVEGGDVELVGRLAEACTALFDIVHRCQEPKTIHAWLELLVTATATCVETPPDERWWVQEVRSALEDLRTAATFPGRAVVGPLLDLGAVRGVLDGALDRPRGAAGYETGAVTLCAMVPMRSIPHRVVALLGLDDRAFPRQDPRLGFDLLDRDSRLGDRDRRVEDRSLFLEAVLAARQSLIVTTTGRDMRTGEPRPSAVPLAELLDVLESGTTTDDPAVGVRAAVTVEHPLQPFSPRNFGDGGDGFARPPLSFDHRARSAAAVARQLDRRPTRFLDGALPDEDRSTDDGSFPDTVDLHDLIQALLHPTRYLLERRLGVHLREYVTEVAEHEPVDLSGLDRARLGRHLLDTTPDDADDWQAARLATGTVPAGTPGAARLSDLVEDVARLRAHATSRLDGLPGARLGDGDTVQVDVAVGTRRLVGQVPGIHVGAARADTRRVVAVYVRPKPAHLLQAWITHLALVASGMDDLRTWIVTRGRQGDDPPLEIYLAPLGSDPSVARRTATDLLDEFIGIRDRARREAVLLFPGASHAYVGRQRLADARRAFEPNEYQAGSGDLDAYVEQVHGEGVSLDDVLAADGAVEEFIRLAERVWGSAVAHHADSVADRDAATDAPS